MHTLPDELFIKDLVGALNDIYQRAVGAIAVREEEGEMVTITDLQLEVDHIARDWKQHIGLDDGWITSLVHRWYRDIPLDLEAARITCSDPNDTDYLHKEWMFLTELVLRRGDLVFSGSTWKRVRTLDWESLTNSLVRWAQKYRDRVITHTLHDVGALTGNAVAMLPGSVPTTGLLNQAKRDMRALVDQPALSYWSNEAQGGYLPIGRVAIAESLAGYQRVDSVVALPNFALTDGQEMAGCVIPIRLAYATVHAFPLIELRNDWMYWTGDVHFHLEGDLNHPDVSLIVSNIERWAKGFTGKTLRGPGGPFPGFETPGQMREAWLRYRAYAEDRDQKPTQAGFAFWTGYREKEADGSVIRKRIAKWKSDGLDVSWADISSSE